MKGKVIGVVGSPCRGKNTGTLVRKVLEGAESQGVETALFHVSDYQIGPCRACGACKQTQACVQDDDMTVFYSALEEAKGLILGTPIYLDHVSAQTKTFLDRLYSYLGPNLEHHYPKGVKSVLVVTWGDSNPDLYNHVITWLEKRLSGYFDIQTVEVIKGENTDAVSTSSRDGLLQAAFNAGVRLVERLQ